MWGTIIHDKLKTVLLNRLIVHKKHAKTLIAFDGPLGNFRQSTDLAHAMGLVNDDIWHDLDCVRKIRNIFAHGTSHCDGQGVWRAISFQTEKVFNLAEKMKCPSIVARLNLDAAHVEEVLGELHAGEQSDLGTTPELFPKVVDGRADQAAATWGLRPSMN